MCTAGPASCYSNIQIYGLGAGGGGALLLPDWSMRRGPPSTSLRMCAWQLDAEGSIFIVNQCQSILSLDVK